MKAIITYIGDTVGYKDPKDDDDLELKRDEKKVMIWGAPGKGSPKVEFPKDEPVLIDTAEAKDKAEATFLDNIIRRAAVSRFFKVEVDANFP